MSHIYINRIATAVPAHNVHKKFVEYASSVLPSERTRQLFRRMADRAQIMCRYSYFEPSPVPQDLECSNFFKHGGFPSTADRMAFYEKHALPLALDAVISLDIFSEEKSVTHLIITSCTGFYAPGLDIELIEQLELSDNVERTMIGFMGCQAAIPALRLAAHIVRSQRSARVLVVNLELCTIHLQETSDLESMLMFSLFGDGCAAAIVSSEPIGLQVKSFRTAVLPSSRDQITWRVRNNGFHMWLDGAVPGTIARGLPACVDTLLNTHDPKSVTLWAVHPGGRSVLDAVESSLKLGSEALLTSRGVLRDYGNMSSATIMFVLSRVLAAAQAGESGCALAFGPGLTAEMMTFEVGSRRD